jgi:hypothetical protein
MVYEQFIRLVELESTLCCSERHLNVLIWFIHNLRALDDNRDLPKRKIALPDDRNQLPFFPATHMFIKKIECLSIRQKPSDEEDLVFLFETFEIDQKKISKKVPASQRDEALDRHSHNHQVAEILQSLNLK